MSILLKRWILVLLALVLPLQAVAASMRVCCAAPGPAADNRLCAFHAQDDLNAGDNVRSAVAGLPDTDLAGGVSNDMVDGAGDPEAARHGLCCLASAPSPVSGSQGLPGVGSAALPSVSNVKASFLGDSLERPPRWLR